MSNPPPHHQHHHQSNSQSHIPSSQDDYAYPYQPPVLPHRGLSVRRSLIHERSTYSLSPSPPPPPEEPSQAYQGQQQSLLQQVKAQSQVTPRVPVPGSGWGSGDRAGNSAYSSVPSGDPEVEEYVDEFSRRRRPLPPQPPQAPQPQHGRGGRSRSPQKNQRMSQSESQEGIAAAGEGLSGRFPIATGGGGYSSQQQQYHEEPEYQNPHPPQGMYHHQQEGGYSPSTSSARGFAAAGAPVGMSGSGTLDPSAPPQRERSPLASGAGEGEGYGENAGYYNNHNQQGDYNYNYNNNYSQGPPQNFQQQQQYYNNNNTNDYYSDSAPLPPPPPLHAGSRTNSTHSLHAAAAAAGLPPPNAPHLMGAGGMSRQSHSSLDSRNSNRRSIGMGLDDGPYQRLSNNNMGGSATALGLDGQIDVDLLDENDPDDGLATPPPPPAHRILTGLRGGRSSHNGSGILVGAAGAGTAAGAVGGAGSGLLGAVNPTAPLEPLTRGVGQGGGGGIAGAGAAAGLGHEKESEWLASQRQSKKKTRMIAIIIFIIVILAIAGGVTAGILLSKRKDSKGGTTGSSNDKSGDSNSDTTTTGGSSSDKAWKDYLDNPALHRVFYGMDYTPLNALYPDCMHDPPTQTQVEIDIAIMSQLTTRLRLYGTDCNQAEMVLDAIQTTGVDMTLWLGIWLDGNATTNARGLEAMYTILAKYPTTLFEGVVIGNEVLFRKEMTPATLESTLRDIKTNLTTLGIDLPIGTSDLGSNWSADLASAVDVIMANIHPFFGGVEVSKAAAWTTSFFETNNIPFLTPGAEKIAMISEVGWPTGGGTLQGSVAGVDELNTLLGDWVCQRVKDGVEYYWFSAFDEPWKVRYNEKGKEWEDKWGLLDAGRELKKGVVIPRC